MKQQVFSLSKTNPDVTLTCYLWEKSDQLSKGRPWQPEKRPAVIICPGGAYRFLSDREAEPVAMQFYAKGYQVFVLRYSLLEDSAYPAPLEDTSMAVWTVRSHAEEWGIHQDKIVIGGFSAGGHIAALLGTRWNETGLAARLNIPEGGNMPNALILSYAKMYPLPAETTLSSGEGVGHMLRVWDCRADVIKNAGKHTPPSFIWHTREDELVPVEESMRFAEALQKNDVPFDLHIFSKGIHGLSLGNDMSDYRFKHNVNLDRWTSLCINWLNDLFDF